MMAIPLQVKKKLKAFHSIDTTSIIFSIVAIPGFMKVLAVLLVPCFVKHSAVTSLTPDCMATSDIETTT